LLLSQLFIWSTHMFQIHLIHTELIVLVSPLSLPLPSLHIVVLILSSGFEPTHAVAKASLLFSTMSEVPTLREFSSWSTWTIKFNAHVALDKEGPRYHPSFPLDAMFSGLVLSPPNMAFPNQPAYDQAVREWTHANRRGVAMIIQACQSVRMHNIVNAAVNVTPQPPGGVPWPSLPYLAFEALRADAVASSIDRVRSLRDEFEHQPKYTLSDDLVKVFDRICWLRDELIQLAEPVSDHFFISTVREALPDGFGQFLEALGTLNLPITTVISRVRARISGDVSLHQQQARRASHSAMQTGDNGGQGGCNYCKAPDHQVEDCTHPRSNAARARKRAERKMRNERKHSRFPMRQMRGGPYRPGGRRQTGYSTIEKYDNFSRLPRVHDTDDGRLFMMPPKLRKRAFKSNADFNKYDAYRKYSARQAKAYESALEVSRAEEAARSVSTSDYDNQDGADSVSDATSSHSSASSGFDA
jgi:hypothetical protein